MHRVAACPGRNDTRRLTLRHGLPNDLATVRLTTPTDFLLALPNEDLLRTVPQLGRVTFTLDRRNP